MSENHITYILKTARNIENPALHEQALSAILQMSEIDENRALLTKRKALRILSSCINMPLSATCHKLAVLAIYRLSKDNDRRKTRLLRYEILDRLIYFACSSQVINSSLKYWSIMLLHQFTLTDDSHAHLIEHDLINVFATLAGQTFGETQMQKICMHSLVRLLSSLEDANGIDRDILVTNEVFKQLAELRIIMIISGCIRSGIVASLLRRH